MSAERAARVRGGHKSKLIRPGFALVNLDILEVRGDYFITSGAR
jgi:hypothetical protein